MDPSKFLRVPGDLKPKSQIPLARPSRISINKQGSSAKKRSSRSSSVNRTSTVNLLQLFGNNGRSRSCASLRDGSSTPVCRPRILSITPSSSSSKYSTNNKEWMSTQLARVRKFLLEFNPEMPALKPLDTKVYVYSMNLLWRELDHRITITEKNKGDIAEYLKLFKFPGQIKPSALKLPSVPQNFSYILTLWAWLLDIIEVVRSPDKILEPLTANPIAIQLYKMSVLYFTNKFNLFNSPNEEELLEPEKEFENNYSDLFLGANDKCNIEQMLETEEILAEEVSVLKKSLSSTQTARDELLTSIEEEERKLNENSSNIEARKEADAINRQEILEKMEHLQSVLKEKKEIQTKLKNALKNQPCSREEWKSMNEEKDTLMYSIQLKKKRKDEKKDQLLKLDMELCDEKHQVQYAVDNINARITSEFQRRPELKELKIRETGFFQEDMMEVINRFIQYKNELDEILTKEQQTAKVALQDIQIEKQQNMLTKTEQTKKREELEAERQKAIRVLEQLRKSNREELEQRELKIKELEEMIEKVINERPNLQQLQDEKDRYSETCSKLIEERDELMSQGREFFTNMFHTVTDSMDARMELRNEIIKAISAKKSALYDELSSIYEKLKKQ